MARPSFQIDPQRLKALRLESGMTQRDLAIAVYKAMGGVTRESDDAWVTHYQRIESKGRTSRRMADAIAAVLQVSVGLLQGLEAPDPENYLQHVKDQLQVVLDKGENQALQRALARHAEAGGDDPLPWLATEISERIEAVQLGRNPSAIAELVELTGLSEEELLKPANMFGHWFVTLNSRGCNRSDIVHGVNELVYHLKELVGDRLDRPASDGFIKLWKDAPWYRMELWHPFMRHLTRIDFVRCCADDKGFRWMPATWQDEFWLMQPLTEWAYSAANFVTAFDSRPAPQDVRRLRLLVTEHDGSYVTAQRQMVVAGQIAEIPEETMASFGREGCTHSLVISWLLADLWPALKPHLAAYPNRCWRVSVAGAVDLHLNPPRSAREVMPGVRYRICLVEETAPNQFAPVPWRQKDKESMKARLDKWLEEPFEPTEVEYDDSLPVFLPI